MAKEQLIIEKRGYIASKRARHIAGDLSWNFGEDVVIYDVRKKSPYVSYYIVASASNDRRLQALKSAAEETIYDNYLEVHHVEGRNGSTWILVDAGQFVIQLFTKSMRNEVNFDGLYKDCPSLPVEAMEEPVYRKKKRPNKPQY